MGFMDYFIRTNVDKLTMFIQNITSTQLSLDAVVGFEGCIDLGNELAKLHMFLVNLFESSSVDSVSVFILNYMISHNFFYFEI